MKRWQHGETGRITEAEKCPKGGWVEMPSLFNETVEARCKKIKSVLASKQEEYATDGNRFHNFDVVGRAENISPVQALWTMKMKHWASILDVVKQIEKAFQEGREPDSVTTEFINQKIGDDINYDILLEGMLRERYVDIKIAKRSWEERCREQNISPCIFIDCKDMSRDQHKRYCTLNIDRPGKCKNYMTPPKLTPQSDQSV